MRFRTWPVAALGLVGLLALIGVFGFALERKSGEIYRRTEQLNEHYREVDARLRRMRSDVYLSGIFVRDYLLDDSRERQADYLEELAGFRSSSLAELVRLETLMPVGNDGLDRTATLRANLEGYWQSFEPMFSWTSSEKRTQSARFLRSEVIPRREAVLTMAREIEGINRASRDSQSADVAGQYQVYRDDLTAMLWQSLGLGSLVTLIAVNRLRVLERRADEQREVAEAAEQRMRELSQQIVATQEEERKHLSRELHDHVGQMLTGLRMELGRIERLRTPDNSRLAAAVGESRELVDDVMRTVRDLALGLRPSMLDDFGLQPALEWLVRDFSRRSRLFATTTVDGNIDQLPDRYATCVYRSVQEALTNCARHSGASRVEVRVVYEDTADPALIVEIKDNGVGIEPERRAAGLGLRGIEERVKELSGTLVIDTGFGTGTTLRLALPAPDKQPGVDQGAGGGPGRTDEEHSGESHARLAG